MEEQAVAQVVSREAVLEHAWRLLQDGQPRMAKQIAAELVKGGLVGVERSLVNSVLSREGKATFVYDGAAHLYSLADPNAQPVVTAAEGVSAPPATPAGPTASRDAVLAETRRLLADGTPRMAKQIAAELVKGGLAGVDKSLVNSVLAREGKDMVEYDRQAYTYRLSDTAGAA